MQELTKELTNNFPIIYEYFEIENFFHSYFKNNKKIKAIKKLFSYDKNNTFELYVPIGKKIFCVDKDELDDHLCNIIKENPDKIEIWGWWENEMENSDVILTYSWLPKSNNWYLVKKKEKKVDGRNIRTLMNYIMNNEEKKKKDGLEKLE